MKEWNGRSANSKERIKVFNGGEPTRKEQSNVRINDTYNSDKSKTIQDGVTMIHHHHRQTFFYNKMAFRILQTKVRGALLFAFFKMRSSRLCLFGINWTRFPRDAVTNVPARLENEWYGRNLLSTVDHPLWRAKQRIVNHLGASIRVFDALEPVVTLEENFDSLLIPTDHVSRSPNDTYYVNAG